MRFKEGTNARRQGYAVDRYSDQPEALAGHLIEGLLRRITHLDTRQWQF
jgi:hypothetical protein